MGAHGFKWISVPFSSGSRARHAPTFPMLRDSTHFSPLLIGEPRAADGAAAAAGVPYLFQSPSHRGAARGHVVAWENSHVEAYFSPLLIGEPRAAILHLDA